MLSMLDMGSCPLFGLLNGNADNAAEQFEVRLTGVRVSRSKTTRRLS